MNAHLPARRSGWTGWLVQLAVVVVVLAVAAATFVLSYDGVHAIAVQAGVPARLARFYPAVLDAVLVIACAAASGLRGARWWSRCYAWLVILIVIAVGGAADAVHAMNVTLPHRDTTGVVAASPWVLLLLAFSLWLSMLRHFRAQHAERLAPLDALSQDFIPTPPQGVAGRDLIPWMTPRYPRRQGSGPASPRVSAPVPGEAVPPAGATPPAGVASPLAVTPPGGVASVGVMPAREFPAPDPEAPGLSLRRVRSLPIAPAGDGTDSGDAGDQGNHSEDADSEDTDSEDTDSEK